MFIVEKICQKILNNKMNDLEHKRKIDKAFLLLRDAEIKLEYLSDGEPYRPLILFTIDKHINVTYNFKGWLCDYLHKSERRTWSCAMNPGLICCHIIACQFHLRQMGIEREWMTGTDFFYLRSPLFAKACHPSISSKVSYGV